MGLVFFVANQNIQCLSILGSQVPRSVFRLWGLLPAWKPFKKKCPS